jgi:Fe-S-cluster containining protein
MIERFDALCMKCTENCCPDGRERKKLYHSPVFYSDIEDLKIKKLKYVMQDEKVIGPNGIILDYWPLDAGQYGKVRQIDSRCMMLNDKGLCSIHEEWRPIFCIMYPFLPYRKDGEIVPIVAEGCFLYMEELKKLNNEERDKLRKEIYERWEGLEEYRIVSVTVWTKTFERVYYV